MRLLETDPAENVPGAFPETADIETSTDAYAARFAGRSGEWMLRVQEEIALSMLSTAGVRSILDVGGGHGQLAIPLARDGYDVTVLGSADECRHRIAGIVDGGQCRYMTGNVIELPFPDRSFDCAVSFRLVTHCTRWPQLIRELCRVARQCVVVDYPNTQSVNMMAPGLFAAKKKMESDVRKWTLFSHREIRDEFARNGFDVDRKANQFLLPMAVHRGLKCRPVSAMIEAVCRAGGLTALAGSPTIVRATRRS